jgi:hypothetical protein
MAQSVLDAIKEGVWDFEPTDRERSDFRATGAMPGTMAKLSVLAERARGGLPLWHPYDRQDHDQINADY